MGRDLINLDYTVFTALLCITSKPVQLSQVTGLWGGRPRFDSRQRQGFVSYPLPPDRLRGPPSRYSSEYCSFFPLG
jgi:hypothetical protein